MMNIAMATDHFVSLSSSDVSLGRLNTLNAQYIGHEMIITTPLNSEAIPLPIRGHRITTSTIMNISVNMLPYIVFSSFEPVHIEYHSLSILAQNSRPSVVADQSKARPKKNSSPAKISQRVALSLYPGFWFPKASSNAVTQPFSIRNLRKMEYGHMVNSASA